MIRISWTLFLFAFIVKSVSAQSPALTLYAGAGTWWPYASSGETSNYTFSNWGLATFSLGTTLEFKPEGSVAFAPSGSVEVMRRRFQVSAFTWLEVSDLWLMNARFSPGLRLNLSRHLKLRLGVSAYILGLYRGHLSITQYHSDPEPDVVSDYSSRVRNQLNTITVGPDLQLLGRIPMGKAGVLEPGFSTYCSLNRSVPRNSPFHFEPGIWQLGLILGWQLPSKSMSVLGQRQPPLTKPYDQL
ncbi:MAG: hypothetical protein U0176_16095 [Bacteroidia bacterium]